MDIRRLKKTIASMPPRNGQSGHKYLVVANSKAKEEILALVEKLPEEDKSDIVVVTEAENASHGLAVCSSGYNGQNHTSGWEGSTYQYAADNGEIV